MGTCTASRAQPPLLAHFLGKPAAAETATAGDTVLGATASDNAGANDYTSRQSTSTRSTNQQVESSFFQKLPSEIRRMIYVEVWRTYGSEGYGDEGCNGDNSSNGSGHSDTSVQSHMSVRGGLSPHITAVMMPSMAWLMSPLPSSGSGSRSNSSRSSSSSSSNRSEAGDAQRPAQQQQQPTPAPWTRQIHGYTAAPCFLAVDDDNDICGYDTNARRDSLGAAARAQRPPPEAGDVRPQRLAAAHRADLDAVAATNSIYENSDTGTPSSTWRARWNSPWLGHWVCEEYYSGAGQSNTAAKAETSTTNSDAAPAYSHSHRRRRPPLRRPYLPVLLSCRRAYIEGIDLLYSALTFQFTEMATAEGFLARWPCVSSVRLVMHMSNSLLEFYQKPGDSDQAIITAGVAAASMEDIGSGGTVINARNNAWQRLCVSLGADSLPNLRKLHVWVEAHDLRGWAKTAAETRLFAQLLAAVETQRRLTPERFVLYLPSLPLLGSKERELPGCYLGEEDEGQEKTKGQKLGTEEGEDEGGSSKGKAVETPVDRPPLPCTIVRTERPNYWDVHMHMRPVYVNRRMSVGSRVSAMRRAGFL
ncbi:hypothetical protein Sste5346_009504 [Sporothrix stenoceras]|uniref:DUF7730 domain-containing protein n=1 Tax=Sporothrix stenoceras TaxID=5173 RepID=A0ABR3YJR0_9PEZI